MVKRHYAIVDGTTKVSENGGPFVDPDDLPVCETCNGPAGHKSPCPPDWHPGAIWFFDDQMYVYDKEKWIAIHGPAPLSERDMLLAIWGALYHRTGGECEIFEEQDGKLLRLRFSNVRYEAIITFDEHGRATDAELSNETHDGEESWM